MFLTAANRRKRLTLLLLLVAGQTILPGGFAARAGDGGEGDPEVLDRCPEVASDPYTRYADLCSAWFRGLWDPVYDSEGVLTDWRLRSLQTTMTVAGDLLDRPRMWAYFLNWQVGPCVLGWDVRDYLDDSESRISLYSRCGDDDWELTPLPAGEYVFADDRITMTLPLDGSLAKFRPLFHEGAMLESAEAAVYLRLSTHQVGGETIVEWDNADPGRTFVIGQDKPEVF